MDDSSTKVSSLTSVDSDASFTATDSGSRTSSSNEGLHGRNIKTLGKSLTEFLSVNATDIVMVLKLINVRDEGGSKQNIINRDDLLSVLNRAEIAVSSVSNVFSSRVVFSSRDSRYRELSRLSVRDGADRVKTLHNIHLFKGGQDFS